MPDLLLSAKHVSKKYGYRRILEDVSLEVHSGDKVWIKGSNGAGKTTLLKIISGMIKPTKGSLFYRSKDIWAEDICAYRQHLGVLFEESYLFPEETLRNNLYFYAEILGLESIDAHLERWITFFSLTHVVDRPIKCFSKGERQKASLIRAFLSAPKLCIFDEPLSGLDAHSQEKLLDHMSSDLSTAYVFSAHEDFSSHPWITRTIDLAKGPL